MAKYIIEDTTLTNIADAIRSKNGETEQYLPSEMPAKIEAIETGGGGGTGKGVISKYINGNNSPHQNLTDEEIENNYINGFRMFRNNTCEDEVITTIDGKALDLVDAFQMFYYNQYIVSLDASKFDMSKVGTIEAMFQYCRKLASLNVSNWDVSKAVYFTNLFYYCNELEVLDVSNWKTDNMVECGSAFYGCSKLLELDLGNWNFDQCTTIANIFQGCTSLKKLRLPNMPRLAGTTVSLWGSTASVPTSDFQFTNGGSFALETTSSTVTLNLTKIWRGETTAVATDFEETYGYFYEAFANSIGSNTSGKTRTIKIYTDLYNTLTDEQKALLTGKGYTIAYGAS